MRITGTITMILAGLILIVAAGFQQAIAQEKKTVKIGSVSITYTEPAPTTAPERIKPESDTDWKAKVNNKNVEVIEVLNILNPVAAYLTAAFEQYGDKLTEMTHDDWNDTVAQLTRATKIYGDCQKRMEAEKFDKKLFLDLEDAWQGLVKTGVAGVRTKSMVDSELGKM